MERASDPPCALPVAGGQGGRSLPEEGVTASSHAHTQQHESLEEHEDHEGGFRGGVHHHHSRRPHTTMEAGLSPPTGQAGGNTPGTHTAGGIAFGRGVSRTPPLIQQRKFTRKMKHRNFGFGFPVGAKSLITRGGDTGVLGV